MNSQVHYISNGPSGFIVYKNKDNEFRLYYEFGSGNCIVIIYLPENWENDTKTSLVDKPGILDFICKKVIEDKAPNSYAEVIDNKWINIMKS